MDYKELEQIFVGQWDEVLKSFGIVVPQMKGKNSINHPCPLCGGDDRRSLAIDRGPIVAILPKLHRGYDEVS